MIQIKQNEDYSKYLQIKYDNGEPVDLTGISAYSEMRTAPNGELLATATCTIDAEVGGIFVLYSADETANIPLGVYGYDVWLVDSEGKKHPIYTTKFEIIGAYTMNLGGE